MVSIKRLTISAPSVLKLQQKLAEVVLVGPYYISTEIQNFKSQNCMCNDRVDQENNNPAILKC